MKCNARFWGMYTAKMMGVVLCTMLALEAVSCLFGYRFETFGSFLTELRAIIFVSAAAMLFAVGNGAQTIHIPLLLSHGETRRNVYIGYNATRLIICALTILISAVLAILSGETGALRALPTEGLVLLCISAFGGIVGTLFQKMRWLGTLFTVVVCAVLGGTAGFLTTSSDGTGQVISALREVMQTTPWWLWVVAAALVCADMGFHWAVLRRREVRI